MVEARSVPEPVPESTLGPDRAAPGSTADPNATAQGTVPSSATTASGTVPGPGTTNPGDEPSAGAAPTASAVAPVLVQPAHDEPIEIPAVSSTCQFVPSRVSLLRNHWANKSGPP